MVRLNASDELDIVQDYSWTFSAGWYLNLNVDRGKRRAINREIAMLRLGNVIQDVKHNFSTDVIFSMLARSAPASPVGPVVSVDSNTTATPSTYKIDFPWTLLSPWFVVDGLMLLLIDFGLPRFGDLLTDHRALIKKTPVQSSEIWLDDYTARTLTPQWFRYAQTLIKAVFLFASIGLPFSFSDSNRDANTLLLVPSVVTLLVVLVGCYFLGLSSIVMRWRTTRSSYNLGFSVEQVAHRSHCGTKQTNREMGCIYSSIVAHRASPKVGTGQKRKC